MRFGQILYYYAYGSYDFPEKFHLMKPLTEIENNKEEKCIFRAILSDADIFRVIIKWLYAF